MNPVLYESTESTFETNGLGVLSDTISCQVVEERNGIFEITLESVSYTHLTLPTKA